MSLCDIIIPVWNQAALTRRCLESVAASTHGPYRLLLVDNGSDARTRQLLDEAARRDPARIQVLRNAENLGFIKAVNQGIRASSAPYVCLLNNDTVVTPGWLEEMLQIAESDPAIGLINPKSTTFGSTPAQRTPAGILAHAREVARARGQTRELSTAIGFCLLIKRAVLDAVGPLDEQYGMGHFEDAELTKRALRAGYRAVLALGAYVYHEEKASFKQQPGWDAAFRANQQAFYRRWGRPLRIIWEAHPPHTPPAGAWTPALTRLLAAGHWLSYSADDGAIAPVVQRYMMAGPLAAGPRWRWRCLWYVLKRRKKPVDLVVTHDAALARALRWLAPCHRAVIAFRPSPEDVEQLCRRLSRCP